MDNKNSESWASLQHLDVITVCGAWIFLRWSSCHQLKCETLSSPLTELLLFTQYLEPDLMRLPR